MSYGLSQNTIRYISSVFARYPQIEQAILYGSRAKGNYKNGSDIDLTLGGNNLNLQIVNKIADDIDNLMLPYIVDLSIYSNISDSELKDHIKRVGIIFYKKSTNESTAVA